MTVYDVTTGKSIGTVASVTGTTVTLTSNAFNPVGSGNMLSFGDLTVDVLSNATISGGTLYGLYGIQANTNNAANVFVTTSAGDIINSGGTGINANSSATSVPSSSLISVTAQGTINSGFDMNTAGGQPGGIWAGYNGGTGTFNSAIAGNVVIDSFATINAEAGAGVGAYNFGIGNISLTLESTSVVDGPLQGVTAFAQGGGNATIVNNGTITSVGGVGMSAGTGTSLSAAGSGTISINNAGTVTALGSSNSPVVAINNNKSTQIATLTNSGSVVASLFNSGSNFSQAINDFNGAIAITNSGSISGNVNLSARIRQSPIRRLVSGTRAVRTISTRARPRSSIRDHQHCRSQRLLQLRQLDGHEFGHHRRGGSRRRFHSGRGFR